jgi:hypothetical protein
MAIIFGELQHIEAETLISCLSDGTWGYCEPHYYIRSAISDEMLADKKLAMLFDVDGEPTIKILSPLSVYMDANGVPRLADGNTRVTAIKELLMSNPEYIFAPIPFRVLQDGWTENDLERLQVAFNDSAQRHETMDLLARILAKHDAFIERVRKEKPKISTKQLQGLVKEYLCQTYQKTEAQLNKYLRLAKAPEHVQELVASEQMALETFILVDGKLDKQLPQEEVAKVYSDLGALAGDSKITERHVKQYFEVPKEAEDSEPVTSKKIKTPIAPEQFTAASNDTFTKLYSVSASSVVDPEVKTVASSVVKSSLKTLSEMLVVLSDDEALNIFDAVKDLVMRSLSDAEHVLERASVSGVEVSEIAAKYNKLDKAVSQLYKALYEKPVTPTEETEIIVTDDVVATIETPNCDLAESFS